jgi:hypothetical protein
MNSQLTAALRVRDEARAEIGAIDSRLAKLERLTQSVSPAATEKATLHSDHAHHLKAWVASNDADAPPPALDADRLARMDAEIRAFESSKASASDGISALLRAREPILARARAAEAALHFAAVEHVATDMLSSLVEKYNDAHVAVVAAKGRLESLHGFIIGEAERRKDSGGDNGLFSLAERLWNEAREKTVAPPTRIDRSEFSAKLNELLAGDKVGDAA